MRAILLIAAAFLATGCATVITVHCNDIDGNTAEILKRETRSAK